MAIKIIQKNEETFAASKLSLTCVHYHFQQRLLVLFEEKVIIILLLVLEINVMFHCTFRLPPKFCINHYFKCSWEYCIFPRTFENNNL